MRFLLDANVLSEPVRPEPHPGVIQQIRARRALIAVPAPVWHELRFGCERLPPSQKRTAIETYLELGIRDVFPIVPYSAEAAAWHATERARLTALGRTPQFVDGQIAAIAATLKLVLVTRNIADFEGFSGLELEDWFRS